MRLIFVVKNETEFFPSVNMVLINIKLFGAFFDFYELAIEVKP